MNNDSINQRLNNIKKRKKTLQHDIMSETKLLEIEKEELQLFKKELFIKETKTKHFEKKTISNIQAIETPKERVKEKDSEVE
ncbi:TPA: hypothetical protein QCQ12_001082, partial [Bacillus cereus biovar anthracis]|nr:hypothetical protein [Bacillus cereus biovar anthracis]